MPDLVREKISKIGQNQSRILIWLGEQQGVTSREDLKRRWPTQRVDVPAGILEPFAQTIRQLQQSLANSIPMAETVHAPYLREEYFLGNEAEIAESEGWVPWRPAAVLGRSPSRTESGALSTALRGLEERGLVRLLKARGKRQRVSHVKLSFEGEVASVLLQRRQLARAPRPA